MTLEFSQNDNAPVNLAEVRFHIPSSELAGDVDPAEAFKGTYLSYQFLQLKIWGVVNVLLFKYRYQPPYCIGHSVVDPKLFFPDPYPTFQEISDPAPDPTQLLSKEVKAKF